MVGVTEEQRVEGSLDAGSMTLGLRLAGSQLNPGRGR